MSTHSHLSKTLVLQRDEGAKSELEGKTYNHGPQTLIALLEQGEKAVIIGMIITNKSYHNGIIQSRINILILDKINKAKYLDKTIIRGEWR